jgi:hypothetical protein
MGDISTTQRYDRDHARLSIAIIVLALVVS